MLYVPIKIYPNRLSLKGCIAFAALWLGIALAGYWLIPIEKLNMAVYVFGMVGFTISMLKCLAVMRKRPMVKVLDDRFSVYTPFGYAMVRFGEVLEFRKGGVPFLNSLRVEINNSSRARFSTGLGRLLHTVWGLKFSNSVSIPGYLLGTDPDSLIRMLEKRRLSAVRLEAIGEYDPASLVTVAD